MQTALISPSGYGRTTYINQNQLFKIKIPYKRQVGELPSAVISFSRLHYLRDYAKTNNGNIYINADGVLTYLFTKIAITRLDFFKKGIEGEKYHFNNDLHSINNLCLNVIGSCGDSFFYEMLKNKKCSNLNFYFLNYCKWDYARLDYSTTEEDNQKRIATRNEIKDLIRQSIELSYWRFLKDEYQKWMTDQYYLILTDNKKIDFIAKGILHGFGVCILLGTLIPFCFVISKIGSFIVSLFV